MIISSLSLPETVSEPMRERGRGVSSGRSWAKSSGSHASISSPSFTRYWSPIFPVITTRTPALRLPNFAPPKRSLPTPALKYGRLPVTSAIRGSSFGMIETFPFENAFSLEKKFFRIRNLTCTPFASSSSFTL